VTAAGSHPAPVRPDPQAEPGGVRRRRDGPRQDREKDEEAAKQLHGGPHRRENPAGMVKTVAPAFHVTWSFCFQSVIAG
jgi:hypothetical protein